MIEKIRDLFFKLFKKESIIGKLIDKFLTKEFVTYVGFGLLTTFVNLGTFYIFKKLFISIEWNGFFNILLDKIGFIKALEFFGEGTDYLDANFIAWVAAVLFAFITNKLWVFESKSWKPSVAGKEFAAFVGARVFSFFIETIMMFIMITLLSWHDLIAKTIVGIVVIILNYFFSKLLIFRKK